MHCEKIPEFRAVVAKTFWPLTPWDWTHSKNNHQDVTLQHQQMLQIPAISHTVRRVQRRATLLRLQIIQLRGSVQEDGLTLCYSVLYLLLSPPPPCRTWTLWEGVDPLRPESCYLNVFIQGSHHRVGVKWKSKEEEEEKKTRESNIRWAPSCEYFTHFQQCVSE